MEKNLKSSLESFTANFSENAVYIGENSNFKNNEILTFYLNNIISEELFNDIRNLNILLMKLKVHNDMTYAEAKDFPENCERLQKICKHIDSVMRAYPPYNLMEYDEDFDLLKELADSYPMFFRTIIPEEHILDESYVVSREYDPEIDRYLDEMNQDINNYVKTYINYLKSLHDNLPFIKSFIDEVISERTTFPSDAFIAETLEKHKQNKKLISGSFKCHIESLKYSSVADKSGALMLCENIEFSDMGSFLYFDFFNGLKNKSYPIRCKNCGKYFLITGGKFTQYCDSTIKGKSGQTCRSLGARQRYDDKCKNDPIWNTYNKAYKAHYARMMKKKMSKLEFMEWGEYALELKRQVISGEIEYEEYYKLIRV